ncbi:D-alanyl-D-alanine carboxypeptidase family protein [Salinibius halmophilus]|nr:D-alanyl-D-alanine carboxypeptidase family protein [Salinibius halmophilus]
MMRLKKLLISATVGLSVVASADVIIPAPPELAAKSYVLIDYDSGDILVEYNANEQLPPASLTKLMTSYIAEQELIKGNISEDETTRVSVKAWQTGGSRMFIQEGTDVSMIDLLRGIIIQSGNDASVAMAEHIAGSEDAFVGIMNQTAAKLGLENTQFRNSTGLHDDEHYSSALDMALLSAAVIRDNAEYYPLYAEREFEFNGINQPNRNRLLWRNPDVDGLKTGHTSEAGYSLVASAKVDGMRLIASVFGTRSDEARAQETQTLLSYGFRYFKTHTIFTADEVIETARVWGGELDELQLGVAEDVVKTIHRGAEDSLEAKLVINPVIKAPIAIGDELGTLTVYKDGEELLSRPVIAKQEVAKGGFFKRTWDAIKLFFWNIFN